MTIAVPIYGARIAPRLSLAKEALIVEFRARTETSRERVDIAHLHPMQLPDFLASKGVTNVIAARVDQYLQKLLRLHNIDVIWGINGDADDVIAFYLGGGLQWEWDCVPLSEGQGGGAFEAFNYKNIYHNRKEVLVCLGETEQVHGVWVP